MVFVLDKNGIFECRKSALSGAGNGVFCCKNVRVGTILPYYGITIDDDDYQDDSRRTYVIAADYTTAYGNKRTAKGLSVDGDPRLPQIRRLEEFKKLACQINEASNLSLPNCILVSNPGISKADIKRSLVKKVPIPITYIVIIKDLEKGTELLTCYGEDYGERSYSPCKISRRTHRELVDRAYKCVDSLSRHQSLHKIVSSKTT